MSAIEGVSEIFDPEAWDVVPGFEDLTDLTIDLGDLPELVRAWDRGVAELIADDAELAGYVASLEADQDEAELPEATGDAIAAEFQRYLRRRGKQ